MINRIFILFFMIIGISQIAGCGEKYSEELVSTSPDNTTIIKVKGYKNSPLSAWITTLSVQYMAFKDSIKFEVFSNEISKETVNFLWNDGECVVSFQQNDGKLNVNVTAKGGKLIIYKPDQNKLKTL